MKNISKLKIEKKLQNFLFLMKYFQDTSADGDGTDCTHPYYTETGQCNLHEYSSFTDDKFTAIAYTTSYSYHDAINAWKTITAELSKLGETAKNMREMQCADDAGIVGVSFRRTFLLI